MAEDSVLMGVNGTFMRGMELNYYVTDLGGTFVREARTNDCYRMWSIYDIHPAIMRTPGEGTNLDLEIWSVPKKNLPKLLDTAPTGLTLGKVHLDDGSYVFGLLAEPFIVDGQFEITQYASWREYEKTIKK